MTDRMLAVNKEKSQRKMRIKEKNRDLMVSVVLTDMFEIPTACLFFVAQLTSLGVPPRALHTSAGRIPLVDEPLLISW